ncbi:MAG: glycosyltransferase [Steroidobacteraceae bacterium]
MRILLVIRSLVIGGAERQCAELACAMAERGHEVTLCTLGQGGPLESLLSGSAVRMVSLGHSGRLGIGVTALRLRRVCRELAPDVIYSFLSVANLLCAGVLPVQYRRRLVWGVRASWMDLPAYGLVVRAVMRLETFLSRRPALIVANSEAGVRHHAELGYPVARLRCVENRIDMRRFQFDAVRRLALRQANAVADGDTVVALVGRIDPIKGHDVFLRAVARVAPRIARVRFWCVGDGIADLKARLLAQAEQIGVGRDVRWLGDVADMAAVYSAADVVVSASLSEGFPNVVAESLACGTPVIGTDVGDTVRMIGIGGSCIRAGDADALALAIEACAGSARPERAVVRREFLQRFDPDLLLARHESFLLAVAREEVPVG